MPTLRELPTPALIVDLDRLESNIERMARRAEKLGVRLRPHVKTHKCVEIGRLQLAAGASGITVSTPHEAEVFATAGFDDMLWAFPLVPSRVEQMLAVAERSSLGWVVDREEAVAALPADGGGSVWIKVDCGYHRCGIAPDPDSVARLARRVLAGGHRLAGLLSHSGDAYDATDEDSRREAGEGERRCIVNLAEALRSGGLEVLELSVGSTPAMTAVQDLSGVTEARPGNYVYFDRTQLELGSCVLEECALTVVATVVSEGDDHAVIDAGALALSKDGGLRDDHFGAVFERLDGGELRDDLVVSGLSQEHGKLSRKIAWGERVRVLPNHSCLTAACFTHVHAVRGERVLHRWRVWNGR